MTEKPIRIQLRRTKGWRLPKNTVLVSRPFRFGNPFIVGKHGTQERCVELFLLLVAGYVTVSQDNVKQQLKYRKNLAKDLKKLKGKNLGCWCKEGSSCHADVLLKIANKRR